MSLDCSDLPPLLAARPLGVLDAPEEAAISRHLAGCPTCQALESTILASLATAAPVVREPGAGVWTAIEARIAADKAAGKAGENAEDARAFRQGLTPLGPMGPGQITRMPERLAPRIALACTFCHSEVLRREAVFCGSCLAPHHEACFLQHGRCAAPGCTETRTVRPRESVPPPARPQSSPFRAPLVALVLATGVAALTVAALTFDPFGHEPWPARPTADTRPAPSSSPARPAPDASGLAAPDSAAVGTKGDDPLPSRTPAPLATSASRPLWTQAGSWDGTDRLSTEVRAARLALEEGRLSDAEDHLLVAGSLGFNVVHEVWGNAAPELEPLRRRRGFFRRAAQVTPAIPDDKPTRDPFVFPAQESPK